MHIDRRTLASGAIVSAALLLTVPAEGLAQGREKRDTAPVEATASVVLTKDMQVQIRTFYAEHTPIGVKPLPPGMRNRLARGKPLPPGIAKRYAPDALRSHLHLPNGYALMEVGLDVVLVEVATNIIHDKLMDVIR